MHLYNGKGKIKQLLISPKTDYEKLLEGLDFKIILDEKQKLIKMEQQALDDEDLEKAEYAQEQ